MSLPHPPAKIRKLNLWRKDVLLSYARVMTDHPLDIIEPVIDSMQRAITQTDVLSRATYVTDWAHSLEYLTSTADMAPTMRAAQRVIGSKDPLAAIGSDIRKLRNKASQLGRLIQDDAYMTAQGRHHTMSEIVELTEKVRRLITTQKAWSLMTAQEQTDAADLKDLITEDTDRILQLIKNTPTDQKGIHNAAFPQHRYRWAAPDLPLKYHPPNKWDMYVFAIHNLGFKHRPHLKDPRDFIDSLTHIAQKLFQDTDPAVKTAQDVIMGPTCCFTFDSSLMSDIDSVPTALVLTGPMSGQHAKEAWLDFTGTGHS